MDRFTVNSVEYSQFPCTPCTLAWSRQSQDILWCDVLLPAKLILGYFLLLACGSRLHHGGYGCFISCLGHRLQVTSNEDFFFFCFLRKKNELNLNIIQLITAITSIETKLVQTFIDSRASNYGAVMSQPSFSDEVLADCFVLVSKGRGLEAISQ